MILKIISSKTLVIITPAVPKTHSEWNYFVEREYNIKRAEVLGIITRIRFVLQLRERTEKQLQYLGHILYMKVGLMLLLL
jgi:UDP-N-acetylmuramate--alanine ligase